MSQFNKDTIPQVAVGFMNDDHHTAVDLMNELISLAKDRESERISDAFNALIQHNIEHFSREEVEMILCGFPPYDCHKGEHKRVIMEMQKELEHWNNTADVEHLYHYLSNTMVSWFHNHINTMDTVTASFIKRFHGKELDTH